MNKYFVIFEQALALKELGFDEPCLAYYPKECSYHKYYNTPLHEIIFVWSMIEGVPIKNNDDLESVLFTVPLYSQAFDWFRNNYSLDISIHRSWAMDNSYYYIIIQNMDYNKITQQESIPNRSHVQAELECLDEIIKIATKEKLSK